LRIGLKNRQLVKEKIDIRRINSLVKEIISRENKKLGEIQIVFLKDEEILEINKNFLKHNYFTDVITFNYNTKDKICGDVCISVESVARNAIRYKVSYNKELLRVIAHGVLHLVGYEDNDKESKGKMRKKENFYMKLLDLLNEEERI
jgi:rRNA maturation RNase YbeY